MRASFKDILDLDRLADWLNAEGIGKGRPEDVHVLQGGTQNLLIQFTLDGRRLVLRRPGLHAKAETEKIITREATLLSALGRTDVPHSRVVSVSEDRAVIGVPFYIMEFVEGFNVLVECPARVQANPSSKRSMSFALVDALVKLSKVDHEAVGLSHFGKLDGYLERQVPRWAAQLASYEKYDSWPGPGEIQGIRRIGEWLQSNAPAAIVPGLIHGDYHIGNALFRPENCGVAAILDWEMAALGDPLLDLARLLISWPDANGQSSLSVSIDWTGFPSQEDLVERYRSQSDRDLTHLPWFEVLACYKLGIILEGTYARSCAGLAPTDTGARLHRSAKTLVARALHQLDTRV